MDDLFNVAKSPMGELMTACTAAGAKIAAKVTGREGGGMQSASDRAAAGAASKIPQEGDWKNKTVIESALRSEAEKNSGVAGILPEIWICVVGFMFIGWTVRIFELDTKPNF